MLDPRQEWSRTDKPPANFVAAKTLKLEPNRTNARTLHVLPKLAKSNTEHRSPMRAIERSEIEDPRFTTDTTDTIVPFSWSCMRLERDSKPIIKMKQSELVYSTDPMIAAYQMANAIYITIHVVSELEGDWYV